MNITLNDINLAAQDLATNFESFSYRSSYKI